MRVIVWGINYAPEFTGIAPHNVALCEFLYDRGHNVEMVTTFPYYPTWQKRPEDRGQLYRTDLIKGVPVHRCWHFVPMRVSALKRILHEASFIFTSTLRLLTLPRSGCLRAGLAAASAGRGGVAHRQDRSARHLSFMCRTCNRMRRSGWECCAPDGSRGRSTALESFAYKRAARVSGITRGMLVKFRRKGVPEEKLVYFPNAISPHER